jgi:putative hydrolase of the HAD superfamily
VSTPRPQGLILDFFGVLTSNMVEVTTQFVLRERLHPSAFLRAWSDPRGQETAWNTRFAELIGADPDNLMERMCWDLYPAHEVLKVAKQARGAGIKTAVLSNSMGRRPYDPYAPYDLRGNFDDVVLSGDHGVRKPDPAIFRLVLDRLGLAAEQCVFVDDSEENLQAASDLGMTIVFSLDERVVAQRLRMLFGLPDL